MTEIQQNRWDQLVRRVAGVVAGGSQVNDTLNELFPTIDVETLNAELGLLSGWRLAFGSTVQTQLAANLNHSQIFNPVGSGQIVVLERVDLFSATAQRIEFVLALTGLASFTSNPNLRDSRVGITTGPIAQLREVQQVGGLPQVGIATIEAGVTFTINEKLGLFVLAPGTGVTFATTIVNSSFNISYLWRERVAQPAELNF